MKKNVIWLAGLAIFAQQPGSEELAARKIYLEDAAGAAAAKTTPATRPNSTTPGATPAIKRPLPPKTPAPATTAANKEIDKSGKSVEKVPVVDLSRPYLAVRYNILECDENGKPVREVDPDTVFKNGQKVRIRFAPSRTGYLYVFAQQSNGEWIPLLPSLMFPEEPNAVQARSNKFVPEAPGLSFEFSGPAGEDRLLLVVSESNEDLYELNEMIRGRQSREQQLRQPSAKPLPSRLNETPEVILAGNVQTSVEGFVQEMTGRDIKVARVSAPVGNEPPHSVYVAQAGGPSDRYILEIKLKHK